MISLATLMMVGLHLLGPGSQAEADAQVWPVVDLHADVLLRLWDAEVRPEKRSPLHASVERLQAGGTLLQVFPIFVSPKHQTAYPQVLRQVALFRKMVDEGRLGLWPPAALGLSPIPAQPKVMGMLALEGAQVLEVDPSRLDLLTQQGLRMVGLVWSGGNGFGSGSGGKPSNRPGLTPLGVDLLKRMERLGLILDLAHADRATFWDAMTLFDGPVLVSHAAVRALFDDERNLDDEQLLGLSQKCGLVGLFYHSKFLTGRRQATMQDWIKHLGYVTRLFGTGLAALGSDFDGGIHVIKGVEDAGMVQVLLRAVRASGFTVAQVQAIASGNALEFFHRTEDHPPCFRPLTWRPLEVADLAKDTASAFDRLSTTSVRLCRKAGQAPPHLTFRPLGFPMTHLAMRLTSKTPSQAVTVQLQVGSNGDKLVQAACIADGRRCLLPLSTPNTSGSSQPLHLVFPELGQGACLDVMDVVPVAQKGNLR